MQSSEQIITATQESEDAEKIIDEKSKEIIKKIVAQDTDRELKAALKEILIFIIFLITVNAVANASQNLGMFFFNQTLERSFLTRTIETDVETEISFADMVTAADWWLFMENVFLTNLHGLDYAWQNLDEFKQSPTNRENASSGEKDAVEEDNENNSVGLSRIFLRDNILLGPPRLRQIRVEQNTCEVHEVFLTYFLNCYAGYTKHNENIAKWYKNSSFHTMSELNVRPVRGEITTYYGAGFVENLTYELEENQKILERLKKYKWIDRGTRAIILEFVLFNINLNMFDNVKIIAEVPPIGGIIPSHQFQALKLHNLWSEKDWVLRLVGVIFYALVFFYTTDIISQLKTVGVKFYFYSVWNILDVFVLLLSYFSVIYNLLFPLYMSKIISSAKIKEFVSIDHICYWNLLYIEVMAICVFLVWIKTFKYVSFNKTMYQFSITLKRCAKDLFGFAIMFFIVFLAYAQLGLLIFGSSNSDFREFSVSIISLMRMFLGDFEYKTLEEANYFLGPIYFLTYVVFVFFILLNMFLAIINDTYGVVKSEALNSQSNFGLYIKSLLQKSYLKRKAKNKKAGNLLAKELDKMSSPAPTSAEEESRASSPDRVRKRVSEILLEYFEDFSVAQELPELTMERKEFQRLNKRVVVLEEVLEQLINNMDRILKKVDSQNDKKKT